MVFSFVAGGGRSETRARGGDGVGVMDIIHYPICVDKEDNGIEWISAPLPEVDMVVRCPYVPYLYIYFPFSFLLPLSLSLRN